MEAAAALTDMYDQALLGILQHVGNVEEFLRVLFGFLYRKTDFYRLLLRPGDRLGFPPGAAQAMTLQAFKVFERMARQDDEKRCRELEAKLRKKEEEEEAAASAERVKLSPAAQEVEVETTSEDIPAPDATGAVGMQESAVAQDAAPSPVSAEPPGATAPAEHQPAELPTRQEQFQTNPDSYNGAVRENYAWSQDFSDLEIKVPVPKHVVKGKQVSVDISNSTIRVAVLEGSSQRVLMEGKLTHKINTESSLWSLEPGKCILRLSQKFCDQSRLPSAPGGDSSCLALAAAPDPVQAAPSLQEERASSLLPGSQGGSRWAPKAKPPQWEMAWERAARGRSAEGGA
ncbi:nudC domain-containing protein 3 isoform X2 [Rissa tridactyla]|uniref:nudC domain-containing protein 3 isoform X2 n=1 Tax=Rissa tridactyla TaxID=75485 RepID=UPI0023BAE8D6|nr:nudC domain-containing protein 3 isoform X2 [Rissa tridactyla]